MILEIVAAGLWAAAAPGPGGTPLEMARDRQDRAALEKSLGEAESAAAKAPGDFDALMRCSVAASYLAEVELETRDKKAAQQAAMRGSKAAEKAVALKPANGEGWRVLGMLYGQAITDLMSGLSYGPRAKDAINKAVSLAPQSAPVYLARGVGNYYLPPQLGGGVETALADFRKAIELDPKNAEAYLWLGLGLRKQNKDAEARQALTKSLELDPNRVWVKQQLEKTPPK